MIRLTGEYTETVIYPVIYKHSLKNKIIINQPDKYLSIIYKVKGFDLSFSNYLNKKKPLIINLYKQNLVKEGNVFKSELNTSKFLKQISEQLSITEESLIINPDSVSLYFINIFHKKVPVKFNISTSFDKQCGLYKPVIYKPDSIIISGVKSDIDNIRQIETEFKVLKKLNKSIFLTLKAIKPKSVNKIDISTDKVTCFIPVEKFTEGNVIVPISVMNNINSKSLRIFPDKVQITYLVALDDYIKVNPSMFVAVVNYLDVKDNEDNKIQVRILSRPEYTKVTKIKPEKVEFIIW